MAHVLILGGGFGGLAAANELRSALPDAEITLVSASDRFYMGFAKLWDLGGIRPLDQGTRPLAGLEQRGVRFVHSPLRSVDLAARSAFVETEGEIAADGLVVALGADPAQASVETIRAARGFDLYDGAQLPAIHDALDAFPGGRVTIGILGVPYKCPPAPYEAALLLADRGLQVRVTTPQPMTIPVAGKDASQYVASYLADAGVELLTEHTVTDDDYEDADVFLGVPAAAPPPVLGQFLSPDKRTLAVPDHDLVYAVGDCTAVPTAKGQLPKAGVFAAGEGAVAARNLAADLGGDDGLRTEFDGHGYCFLELPGRRVAVVEGDFYAEPEPDVALTEATEGQFARKQAYEQERLAAWLG
jgi:sulfide:quinone oxidoreductase